MKWIEIVSGCEMPKPWECVIICDGEDWTHACHVSGRFYALDSESYSDMTDHIRGVTHWARVELPDGN